jgi:hypothetical protein
MRVLIAFFEPNRLEAYSSLTPFLKQYPQYAELKHKINYRMSRLKQPYRHPEFTLFRLKVKRND